MWKQITKFRAVHIILVVAVVLCVPAFALAAQSESTSYQVNEVFFGSGGELDACSSSFCSKQAAGELATGSTTSPGYQAQAGFNTDRTPYIQFTVSNTNINLGTMTSTTSKTATSTFSVKAYLSHGYNVVNASDPPTNNSHTMQAMTLPGAPALGTEQFGINLAANNEPVVFGADPVHVPDNTFSYGVVAADYNAANLFKYVKGETVAYSTSSSSATTYTVSYLFNVSPVTPGGAYSMNHVLVATATY
jgi:hypothetical protein